MKLSQTGPETNKFGELITRFIAESSDKYALCNKGYEIAENFQAHEAMWIGGSNWSRRLRMEVRSDVFLGIDP